MREAGGSIRFSSLTYDELVDEISFWHLRFGENMIDF
jgi:hypothetical protein